MQAGNRRAPAESPLKTITVVCASMAWLKCPQCATVVDVPEGQEPRCSRCGYGSGGPAQEPPPNPWGPGAGAQTGPQGYVAPQVNVYTQYQQGYGKPPVTQGVAIVALLLNILVWPGLGSLIAGEAVGWAQGFLMLAGVILVIVVIGIPMMLGAWIWGIITGVELLRRAETQPQWQAP